MAPVVLLTDFGNRDPYVGIMKGVVLGRNPNARIIDLCHEVPPQDVRAAAFYLLTSASHFPKGSIFVTVVDPGVGSERRILWARTDSHQFLFPDNGVLSWLERKRPLKEIREVSNKKLWLESPSSTFHGRDIFAPVAGSLSRGVSAAKLGPKVGAHEKMPFPLVSFKAGTVRGEILAIDRFGNAISNIRPEHLKAGTEIRFKRRSVGAVRAHYAQGREGAPLALSGSSGFVELSVRNGDFARKFGARAGDIIECY